MADEKVVNAGQPDPAPSALESAIASSPEVAKEAEVAQEAQTETAEKTGTQEQPQIQEEGKIPYSRFKEKVDEANWYKQQLELTIRDRQQQLSQQQPTQDPYQGMTAEEKVFWQGIDKRIEERASKIAEERLGNIRPIIDAGRMELAQIKVQQFRSQHPDIKPNSPEEMDIAQKIQMGYTPDDAYWATMGPRGFRTAAEQGKQQAKQQVAAKKLANVETSPSIPAQTQNQNPVFTVPKNAAERQEIERQRKLAFRVDLDKRLREAGI